MVWDRKNPRFVTVYDIGNWRIIVDKETGVNYLWYCSVSNDAITPLLDGDGRPVITSI